MYQEPYLVIKPVIVTNERFLHNKKINAPHNYQLFNSPKLVNGLVEMDIHEFQIFLAITSLSWNKPKRGIINFPNNGSRKYLHRRILKLG